MSDAINSIFDFQEIDIIAKLILLKKVLPGLTTLWRNNESSADDACIKKPFRIYVVNDGSIGDLSPLPGSPAKCVKLCKRSILPGYPKNTLLPPCKSKIAYRFALSLLIEYENGNFAVAQIPKELATPSKYVHGSTAALCDVFAPRNGSAPLQLLKKPESEEKLTLVTDESGVQTSFEYGIAFSIDDITSFAQLEQEDQNLQSFVHLKNTKFTAEVQEQALIGINENKSVWATGVDLSLSEDLILKIGIDQDIVVRGMPGP